MSGYNNHPLAYPRTVGNSFAKFDTDLGKRESRKIGNNTYAQRRPDGSIVIRLHTTDVVTYHADGTVTLCSGGWETVTTKDRFNKFGPEGIVVSSIKTRWIVFCLPWTSNLSAPFIDGMTFDPSNFEESTEPYRSAGFELEKARKLTADRIKGFVAKLDKEALDEVLAASQRAFGLTGDCLVCRTEWTQLRDASEKGETRKVYHSDRYHIALHVTEGYYFGTLFMNALVWAGYREWQFPYNIGDLQTVKRSLKRYLGMRLNGMSCADWQAVDSEVSQ